MSLAQKQRRTDPLINISFEIITSSEIVEKRIGLITLLQFWERCHIGPLDMRSPMGMLTPIIRKRAPTSSLDSNTFSRKLMIPQ